MDKENQKVDDSTEQNDFTEMLQKSLMDYEHLEPGQKVQAKAVRITDDWVFIDVGQKSEGYLDKKEFIDKDGTLTVHEGDTIEAFLLSTENENEMLFTTKIGKGAALHDHLEDAYKNGIPIEGFVEKEIKGGFDVKITGGVRAFCPYSQMGLVRGGAPETCTGQHLCFIIKEYGENGRKIILSNRAFQEKERQKQKAELKESLREGMAVKGRITSIRDFGAFVDIGGLEGLIPVSEIGWGRINEISETISVGQEVEVIVLKLDWEKNRFSFSHKETLPDPWADVEKRFPEGSIHSGKVVRLESFGAFVSLGPGIDGLLHISALGEGKKIKHPKDLLQEGQEVQVRISSINDKKRRISLSLAEANQRSDKKDIQQDADYKNYMKTTQHESSRFFNTLGDMIKAKLGEKQGE